MAVIFTMSVVPGFAASKKITLVGEKTYVKDGDEMKLDKEWKETYNSSGRVKKYITKDYYLDDLDFYHSTSFSYTYTKSGKVKTLIVREDGEITGKYVSTYKNGKLSKETYYTYKAKKKKYVKDTYTVYKYTSSKITATEYNKKDKATGTKNITTLDSKKRVKKIVYYFEGKKDATKTFEYFSNGKLKKEVRKDRHVTDTDTYNKQGQLIKNVYDYPNEDMYVTTKFKYNDNGLLIKKTEVSDDLKTTYTYKYSNFYKSKKKYPQLTKIYYNNRLDSKVVSEYKKI